MGPNVILFLKYFINLIILKLYQKTLTSLGPILRHPVGCIEFASSELATIW